MERISYSVTNKRAITEELLRDFKGPRDCHRITNLEIQRLLPRQLDDI